MRLYLRECRNIAKNLVYYLFIAILVFGWFQNFRGVTQTEIDWANGIPPASIGFERPLLSEPSEDDGYFGTKLSEEDPEKIMTGVTRALLSEYESNNYATYPLGYYKALSLDDSRQKQVLEILREVTGLTQKELENLPEGYFPAVTGTIMSFDSMKVDENGNFSMEKDGSSAADRKNDKHARFTPQVSYDRFKELMREMESIIGEAGSQYSPDMMVTYFGLSEMTYEEAVKDYSQTVSQDQVTGGFARLFCDYMGLELGLYPVFLVVIMWMKDRTSNAAELIYSRKVSSARLVVSRYLAAVTMVLIPVFLLSLESLVPLVSFGAANGLQVDWLAYLKYISWWLLPEVMTVCAAGTFFTLLTDSPIAILILFFWWMIDKGVTGLSGDTKLTTLMIRHNTLRGYEIIQDNLPVIWTNRMLMVALSVLFIGLSIWVLALKRRGKINAANICKRCFESVKGKFSTGSKN